MHPHLRFKGVYDYGGEMSSPGFESVFSSVGNLRHEIESKLHGKVDRYEITSIISKVDSLENSIRGIRSTLDGFRAELQALQESKLNDPYQSGG